MGRGTCLWLFGSALWALHCVTCQREMGDVDFGCPQGSYYHGNYCFVVSSIFVTYEDAEILCETGGGLLAPVKDAETQFFLQKLRVRKFLHRYWFGLDDKKTEGEWLHADGTRMSGFSKWHRGEPNNFGKNQHCVNMWLERHLEWDDDDCARKLLYICEYPDTNCSADFPTYGRSCYELSQEFATYDEAEILCRKNGGDLAVIKTEGTFNFLKSIIYKDRFWLNMTEKNMQAVLRDQTNKVSWIIDTWIGVRFLSSEWVYSDGTSLSFSNWAPGEPFNVRSQEDCVKLGQSWNDVQCDLRHGFICRYPVNEAPRTLPTDMGCTLSAGEASDPLLQSQDQKEPSSSAIQGPGASEKQIHLGAAQFSMILVGCILIGMILVSLAITIIVWYQRRRRIGSSSLREDQDLEVLGDPETEED